MFYIILFLSWFMQTETAQPYFPPDITFVKVGLAINYTYAIDVTNQRAYYSQDYNLPDQQHVYAMKHFPYATPDSPQSKYYVVLNNYENITCEYSTAWQYGGVQEDYFPRHWFDEGQIEIKNYMMYSYEMIHSHTSAPNEDYWYSSVNCSLDTDQLWPCEEMFFKKNTDIPLRHRYIVENPMHNYQVTVEYHIISIGKPDDRYFQMIPKDWANNCTDLNLGLDLNLTTEIIPLHESTIVGIRLFSPPHRINGNDTMILEWKVAKDRSDCLDCLTWEPKQFYFNTENFYQYQNLTVTRVKNGSQTAIHSLEYGGGYEKLPWYDYVITYN